MSRRRAIELGTLFVFWVAVIGTIFIAYMLGGDPTAFRYTGF